MFIPVLVGTARKGNYSTHAANLVIDSLKSKNIETELVSPKEFVANPFTERVGKEKEETEADKKYRDIITRADAIVVVTPEYNRSYPGELKLMIDLLYPEYNGKIFAFVGVSDGFSGGVRAVEQLIHTIVGVEGLPLKPKLFFSNCNDIFDGTGKLLNEDYREKCTKFVDSLLEKISP